MQIKRKPKLIFFDVGHVLVRKITDYEEDAANILGITQDEFEILHEDLITKQPQDRVDLFHSMRTVEQMNEYFNQFHIDVLNKLEITITDKLLHKLLEVRYGNYELMEDAIESLEILSKSFKLGIISNAFPSRRTWDLPKFGLIKYFDPIIISFEIGIHKPDRKIYEYAIKQTGLDPKEIMFVDDKIKNLVAAVSVGIDNCVFISDDIDPTNQFPIASNIKELTYLLSGKQ